MEPLSAETHRGIQKALEGISHEHELAAEEAAELAGHLEDKVRGYLSGEEKLTEADALLLARTRLGNPEVIGALLREAKGGPVTVSRSFFERLVVTTTALVLSTALLTGIMQMILVPLLFLPASAMAHRPGTDMDPMPFFIAALIFSALTPLIFEGTARALERWMPGKRLVRPSVFIAGALLLNILAIHSFELVRPLIAPMGNRTGFSVAEQSAWRRWIGGIAALAGVAVMLIVWFRRTLRGRLSMKTAALSMAWWMGAQMGMMLLRTFDFTLRAYAYSDSYRVSAYPQPFKGFVMKSIVSSSGYYLWRAMVQDLPVAIVLMVLLWGYLRWRDGKQRRSSLG